MNEVAALAAIFEHVRRVASGDGAPEDAGHAGVRGVTGHPRPVDVVVSQRGHARPIMLAGESPGEVLVLELRRRVHVPGIDRRAFGHGPRDERRTALLAERFVTAGGERHRISWWRGGLLVRVAPISAFAVYDHAAGERHPPTKLNAVERAQEGCRPEVVVVYVVGDVVEVDAQSDHCGLVRDGVDARNRRLDRRGVGDVAPEIFGPVVAPIGNARVRGGKERIENAHVVAFMDEGVDYVRAYES